MFSKRFLALVGVGILSVATIPAFAAPHLARLTARKPAAKLATAHKAKPVAKAAVKPAAAAAKAAVPIDMKKTAAGHAAKPVVAKAKRPTAGKQVAVARKVAQPSKAVAGSKKNLH